MMTESQVKNCLTAWGKAVESKEIETVLSMYHEEGSLHPTLDNTLRVGRETIRGYFENFLPKIKGAVTWEFETASFVCSPVLSSCSGFYTFQLEQGSVRARFSYTVEENNGKTLIRHHHSSLIPG